MKNNIKKGFTLVEVLVAIGLFSILVAIAAGGFVNALRTQRQVAALVTAQSNASLALEQMTREIRTGYLFCDSTDPANPNTVNNNPVLSMPCASHCVVSGDGDIWTCDLLDFYNAQSEDVDYSLAGGQLMRSANGGTAQSITGGTVSVSYLKFIIFGNIEGDQWAPRITISMGVAPRSTDPAIANNILNLQTTASAREIDCNADLSSPC
jgi:prepilin-type N-terminal cleavage/methylation domain-containing protein